MLNCTTNVFAMPPLALPLLAAGAFTAQTQASEVWAAVNTSELAKCAGDLAVCGPVQ